MFWSIIVAAAILWVLWRSLSDEETPVDKLPGPPRYPVIGCVLYFLRITPPELFLRVRFLAKKHGDKYLVKIFKRRILHLVNPQDAEILLSHPRNISKSIPYGFLKDWLGNGLLVSTGSYWQTRRKILTPTFHFNILKNFSTVIEEKSKNFVKTLEKTQDAEVDLFPVVSNFTLYTICETAMGTQLDADKSTESIQYKNAIMQIGELFVYRLTRVWLFSDLVFKNVAVGKRYKKLLGDVHSFCDKVIIERKSQRKKGSEEGEENLEGTKRRMAMLDLLLAAEARGEIDLAGIRDEVNTFMFEGHDTTATAIVFALMLLADHENIQDRVFEECKAVLGDRSPTMADLAELKYLEAVIKETMRLYPSVPFIGRLITEDFMLGDLEVRKGQEVAVHIYDIHRRPDLYPDPEAFQPERFLNGEKRHPYAYIPFSAGSRNCIGQRFAMQEMKCALAEICKNFRILPKTKGFRPQLTADLVLRSADPIYVKFIKR